MMRENKTDKTGKIYWNRTMEKKRNFAPEKATLTHL